MKICILTCYKSDPKKQIVIFPHLLQRHVFLTCHLLHVYVDLYNNSTSRLVFLYVCVLNWWHVFSTFEMKHLQYSISPPAYFLTLYTVYLILTDLLRLRDNLFSFIWSLLKFSPQNLNCWHEKCHSIALMCFWRFKITRQTLYQIHKSKLILNLGNYRDRHGYDLYRHSAS